MWMTQADWYVGPPYSDVAFAFDGVPGNGLEMTWQIEFWHVFWDDFNWEDPEGSVIHDMQEGQIMGVSPHNWDMDNSDDWEDENFTLSNWALTDTDASENADFIPDWELLPVMADLLPTAVEDDTWGHIKASMVR
jgi:hypothetical protein